MREICGDGESENPKIPKIRGDGDHSGRLPDLVKSANLQILARGWGVLHEPPGRIFSIAIVYMMPTCDNLAPT